MYLFPLSLSPSSSVQSALLGRLSFLNAVRGWIGGASRELSIVDLPNLEIDPYGPPL